MHLLPPLLSMNSVNATEQCFYISFTSMNSVVTPTNPAGSLRLTNPLSHTCISTSQHAFTPNPPPPPPVRASVCECIWIIWRISWTCVPSLLVMPSAYLMLWAVDGSSEVPVGWRFLNVCSCVGVFKCLYRTEGGFSVSRGRDGLCPVFPLPLSVEKRRTCGGEGGVTLVCGLHVHFS